MNDRPDLDPDTHSQTDQLEKDWSAFLDHLLDRWSGKGDERKQDRSRRRQQEILRAALRVFARDGILRARIGDIAAESGMPVSSIYEYYSSKEELAYEVPLKLYGLFFSEYAEGVATLTSARARLKYYLWLSVDFARRNPDWSRTLYLEIWPSVLVNDTAVQDAIDDYARLVIRLIRQGEARGEWPPVEDVYQIATILNGSVSQLIISWLIYRQPRNLMKSADALLDRALRLLDMH
jgi:AcrR family transcriptional regulator